MSAGVFSWTVADPSFATGCDHVLKLCHVVLNAEPSRSPRHHEPSGPHAPMPGSAVGVSLPWIDAASRSRIAAVLFTKFGSGGFVSPLVPKFNGFPASPHACRGRSAW